MSTDLNAIKKIYFIGIKGVAMSGLALICKQRGMEVGGSDVPDVFITDASLMEAGITWSDTFSADNLDYIPDLVVVGASWGDDHVEVIAARKRSIPIVSDSEFRGLLSKEKRTISITGVHGKTTTTALLAHIFSYAGLQPSYLIGTGEVKGLPSHALWDTGEHFIVEGDEYSRSREDHTPKFLDVDSVISLITSVEWEHVDIYDSVADLEEVYARLIEQTRDAVVVCTDWPSIQNIATERCVTYGLQPGGQWQAYNIREIHGHTHFTVAKEGAELGDFVMQLWGEHNVSNALACIAIALHEGIELGTIDAALRAFEGLQRRTEVVLHDGVTWIDDYGHHPTEIQTTLKAVRRHFPDQQIWCLFQSHTTTRTKALLDGFAQSFGHVDHVGVLDIFTSARETTGEFTAHDLVAAIAEYHSSVVYTGSIDQTTDFIQSYLANGVVVVTMGAGQVYKVRDNCIQK